MIDSLEIGGWNAAKFAGLFGEAAGMAQQVGQQIRGYAANGSPAGWYDPAINATYDRNGHRVGIGDLLTSLIVSGR